LAAGLGPLPDGRGSYKTSRDRQGLGFRTSMYDVEKRECERPRGLEQEESRCGPPVPAPWSGRRISSARRPWGTSGVTGGWFTPPPASSSTPPAPCPPSSPTPPTWTASIA